MAILAGCREALLPFFPDGRRPDVLRFDSPRRHLFVGDAKDSESPGCRETRERLARYTAWLRANAMIAGSGTLALCHSATGASRWLELLEMVARDQGFDDLRGRQRRLDTEIVISWLELPLTGTAEAAQAAGRTPRPYRGAICAATA
jgi:hypothetical protein